MRGIKKLEKFASERLGTDIQGMLDKLASGDFDTYQTLDRFFRLGCSITSSD
jgi:hypothetical protein